MIPYLSLFAVLSAFGLGISNQQQRWILPFILIFLFWFMGWRFYVGCDFLGYLSRYENTFPWGSPLRALDSKEPAFELIMTSVKINGLPYLWINIICSAIILLSYFRYFRTSSQPLRELSLLFPVIIVQLSMSGLRQGIAVAMLTAACAEFIKGRRLATAAWIILAAQFHNSVAAFLPLALLVGRSISFRQLLLAVAVLTPVAAYLMGERFDDYADQYVRQIYGESASAGAFPRYILVLLPSLYFWKFRREFQEKMPEWYPLFQAFSLGVIFIAPLFLVSSLIVHRMTFYFMPVTIMIAASAYRVCPINRMVPFVRWAPFLMYGGYFVSWFALSAHADSCYIPYQSYTFQ